MLDKIKGFIAGMHMPDVQVLAENQNQFGLRWRFRRKIRGVWRNLECHFFGCGERNGRFLK